MFLLPSFLYHYPVSSPYTEPQYRPCPYRAPDLRYPALPCRGTGRPCPWGPARHWTDRQTDGQMNRFPEFYRTSSPSGPLPKNEENRTTFSKNKAVNVESDFMIFLVACTRLLPALSVGRLVGWLVGHTLLFL